jgi:hypothetical protein
MTKVDKVPAPIIGAVSGAIGFLLGRLWTIRALGGDIDWPATFESLSSVAQVIALVIGGWWTYRLFVRQRVDKARANITHSIQSTLLPGDSQRFVRVVVNIHNVGNVELKPPGGYTEIEVAEISPGQDKVGWKRHGDEYKLPFRRDGLTLEPGEVERYSVDFSVPAQHEMFQVHTRIECGDHHPGDFWDETDFCGSTKVVPVT